MTSHVGVIQYVVVYQRRGVDHLDDDSESEVLVAHLPKALCRK